MKVAQLCGGFPGPGMADLGQGASKMRVGMVMASISLTDFCKKARLRAQDFNAPGLPIASAFSATAFSAAAFSATAGTISRLRLTR